VIGWPVGTFVRGSCVMWQGEIMGPATGQPAQFIEALNPEK
jgi:dihydroorotase